MAKRSGGKRADEIGSRPPRLPTWAEMALIPAAPGEYDYIGEALNPAKAAARHWEAVADRSHTRLLRAHYEHLGLPNTALKFFDEAMVDDPATGRPKILPHFQERFWAFIRVARAHYGGPRRGRRPRDEGKMLLALGYIATHCATEKHASIAAELRARRAGRPAIDPSASAAKVSSYFARWRRRDDVQALFGPPPEAKRLVTRKPTKRK